MNALSKQDSRPRTPALEASPRAPGVEDASGWGLLGLTLGILAGFAASLYLVIPLFPTVHATGSLTVMTVLVVAAMTMGGGIGYLATRGKARPRLN